MGGLQRFWIRGCGVGSAAVLLAAGCQTKPHAVSSRPPVNFEQQIVYTNGPATQPATTDAAPPGTAEVLAEKAQSYARSMAPMLQQHPPTIDNKPIADAFSSQQLALGATTQPATSLSTASTDVSSPTPRVLDVANAQRTLATKANPTATPSPLSANDNGGVSTDALARQFAQHVHDYPQDLAGQLDYQLLLMLQGQSVPQLNTLSPLAPEDREVLSALLDGITNFRDGVRADNNMLLSRKVQPMLDMADRLRAQAELSIPTVALCRRVAGFGVYDAIEGARFTAGRDTPVVVYCEVENFSSHLNDQKMWETKLKLQVVLYTEDTGQEVWRQRDLPAGVDYSRHRRHDFFMAEMIHLPSNLSIGRYLLKVSVEDQEVNRIAENTVGLEIAAN